MYTQHKYKNSQEKRKRMFFDFFSHGQKLKENSYKTVCHWQPFATVSYWTRSWIKLKCCSLKTHTYTPHFNTNTGDMSILFSMARHNRVFCKCILHGAFAKRVFYQLPWNVYCIFMLCLYKSWRFSKTIHEWVKSSRLNPQISICDARQTHCALRGTINAPNKQINESQIFISVCLCAREKERKKKERKCTTIWALNCAFSLLYGCYRWWVSLSPLATTPESAQTGSVNHSGEWPGPEGWK